jgi:thiol:disulfide interchange protein DsbD
MVRLRQLLAFPLYASALWLAWVLGAQLDINAVARLGAMLLLIALALWAWPSGHARRTAGSTAWKAVAVASLLAAAIFALPLFSAVGNESQAPVSAQADGRWQPFSAERVVQLTTSGRPVFVDFTAAWCVTCQVNKKLVLNTAAVEDAFERSGVARVRADWTRRDAAIGSALAALGRSGVPVYVLYRPGKAPLLLPEVLQQRIILEALATL